MSIFSADPTTFLNFISLKFFGHKNVKKPPEKVAYLSRISDVSEIFSLLPNSPKGRNHIPKCGLKSNCIYNLGPVPCSSSGRSVTINTED